MAKWHPVQVNFSGGEVDLDFLMRQDTEDYGRSVLILENWIPTLLGSVRRAPGTRYILDIADELTLPSQRVPARVVPFIDATDDKVLLLLTDGDIRALTGTLDFATGVESGTVQANGQQVKQVMPNPEFKANQAEWEFDPAWYTGGNGDELGVRYSTLDGEGAMEVVVRDWKYPNKESDSAFVRGVATVDVATDKIRMDYRVVYTQNFGGDANEFTANIIVGTTEGGSDIGTIPLSDMQVGEVRSRSDVFFDLPASYTGPLYVRFDIQATENRSTPVFFIDRIAMYANSDATIVGVSLISPYEASELDAVQYLQSPHGDKEMVFVHPNHPPYRFYFDTVGDTYVMEPIPFDATPGEWGTNNYPCTLTAYQGRLILGGVPSDPEIIWGTEVFDWTVLTIPATPTPSDPLKFVTTFRSATHWLAGHKDLIVGAKELEYAVRSETGILQSGDIDARVHSTHGGAKVQPVGFGQYVAFAAERGTRLRTIGLDRDNEGWIAPDKSIKAAKTLIGGIKRLVRMRNPVHMLVCLLGSGDLAVLVEDTYVGVSGWARIRINASIRDICVLADDDGTDVLFCVVDRSVGGNTYTYLEAFGDWTIDNQGNMQSSHKIYSFTEPTSVITGLEHLEGNRVQVTSGDGFVGTFLVTGGQITLETEDGVPLPTSDAVVGMATSAVLTTLLDEVPDEAGGVGTLRRNVEIGVRCLNSRGMVINGQRAPERFPFNQMDKSSPGGLFYSDFEITDAGHGYYIAVTLTESLPLFSEILAIYKTYEASKV